MTVTDTLPSGLTATALSGTGWTLHGGAGHLHAQRRAGGGRELSGDHADGDGGGDGAGERDEYGERERRRRDQHGEQHRERPDDDHASPADLTITKTHAGHFTQGQIGRDLHADGAQQRAADRRAAR